MFGQWSTHTQVFCSDLLFFLSVPPRGSHWISLSDTGGLLIVFPFPLLPCNMLLFLSSILHTHYLYACHDSRRGINWRRSSIAPVVRTHCDSSSYLYHSWDILHSPLTLCILWWLSPLEDISEHGLSMCYPKHEYGKTLSLSLSFWVVIPFQFSPVDDWWWEDSGLDSDDILVPVSVN